MTRADQPQQEGTALNKANLLTDETAEKFGFDGNATPNEVMAGIGTIQGTTDPTEDTVGQVGQSYINTATGYKFYCSSARGLPEGYTELEYIESTGTQYIDTGIPAGTNNARIVTKFLYHSEHSALSMWSCYDTSPYGFILYGSRPVWYIGTTGRISCGPQTELNTEYTLDAKAANGTLTAVWDGTTYTATYSGTPPATYGMRLFGSITSSGALTGTDKGYRLYYWRLYNNDSLVLNFVPCKSPSGEIGLFNLVDEQFYGNDGTGTFTAGPEVSVGVKYTWEMYAKAIRTLKTETITSTKQWTVPTHVGGIDVLIFGGGGGGGGSGNNPGGGGGGGAMAHEVLDLTEGTPVQVTIGAGGSAGAAGFHDGGTGGTSSFGVYLSAAGGEGGWGSAGHGGDGGTGGGTGPGSTDPIGGAGSYGGGGGGGYNDSYLSNGGAGGPYGGGGGGGSGGGGDPGGAGGAGGTYGGAGGQGGGGAIDPTAGTAGTNTMNLTVDFPGTGAGGIAGTNGIGGDGGGGGGGGYGGVGGAGGEGGGGGGGGYGGAGGAGGTTSGGGGGGYGSAGGAGGVSTKTGCGGGGGGGYGSASVGGAGGETGEAGHAGSGYATGGGGGGTNTYAGGAGCAGICIIRYYGLETQ